MSNVNEEFEVDNRKRLHLNTNGIPTGSIALCYHRYLAAFTKELNLVTKGWQGQTEEARSRFMQRVNTEYRFVG
jgi:hypothetical protein